MNRTLISLLVASALAVTSGIATAAVHSNNKKSQPAASPKVASSNVFSELGNFLSYTFGNLDHDNNPKTGSFFLYDHGLKVASINYSVRDWLPYSANYSFTGLLKNATYSGLTVDYLFDSKGSVSIAQNNWAGWGSRYLISSASVKYVIASVPEPETYAMFLAGLGLLGVAAKRRKQAVC